jgi:chromosome segregation ATPase
LGHLAVQLQANQQTQLQPALNAVQANLNQYQELLQQYNHLLDGYKSMEQIWSEREGTYKLEQVDFNERLSAINNRMAMVLRENTDLQDRVRDLFTANTVLREGRERLMKIAQDHGASEGALQEALNIFPTDDHSASPVGQSVDHKIYDDTVNQLSTANQLIESLRTTNAALDMKVQELNSRLGDLQPVKSKELLDAQSLLQQSIADRTKSDTLLAQTSAQLTAAQSQIADLQRVITGQTKELAARQQDVTQHQQREATLQKSNAELARVAQGQDATIQGLKDANNRLQAQLDQLGQSATSQQSTVQGVQTLARDRETAYKTATNQLVPLIKENAQLKTAVVTLESEYEQLLRLKELENELLIEEVKYLQHKKAT